VIEHVDHFLIDTKPIPVVGYKRSKAHSDFAGSANYGYCASRNLHYFGYKLVMVTTLDGLPVLYELVPANIEERQAAETVLDRIANAQFYGDEGFLGDEWQTQIEQQTGNQITTPKRVNQTVQHPAGFERLLAKTVVGLVTRVIMKVTSHLLRHLLLRQLGLIFKRFNVHLIARFNFI
jgi:hypothetical protein